jgi:hypothetical protein
MDDFKIESERFEKLVPFGEEAFMVLRAQLLAEQKELNTLRNHLAHKLEPDVSDIRKRMRRFVRHVGSRMRCCREVAFE